jgi:glycosyltransferase involved in cell wall biosynthesis
MIYLDATSSCRSVQNTGMQRMTRKIFAELSRRTEITPICWNQIGKCYQTLGPTEWKLLTRPFDVRSGATARPESRSQNPVVEFLRLISLPRFRFESLVAEDVFLAPDIFHDSRRRLLPDLLSRTKARTAAIFHDATTLRLTSIYPAPRRRVRHRTYTEALSRFDVVICISRESRDDLEQFWRTFGCKPTVTCVELWPMEFDAVRPTNESDQSTNLVVYVSSLESRKNHLLLLRAVERLWKEGLSFELHLIGRTTGLFGRRVVKQVRNMQNRGYAVRWLRHVDDATLLRAYHDCRFTVYPSLMEGFGLPIAESLWHGKPCICGGNGALGEVARGGGCLIVDQTSEEALAAGMKKLLTDQESYRRLCDEARARTFRTWKDYIDNLLTHLPADHTADQEHCGVPGSLLQSRCRSWPRRSGL